MIQTKGQIQTSGRGIDSCRWLWAVTFLLGCVVSSPLTAADEAADADQAAAVDEGVNQQFARSLKQILRAGLRERAELSQVARLVEAERQSHPQDPALSYTHGLILQSRLRHDAAAEEFAAALRADKGYSGAWRALICLKLNEKSPDALCDQLVMLAEALAKPHLDWSGNGRRQLAAWLGRVHGFLAQDDVGIVAESVLLDHIAIARRRLPDELQADYDAGRRDFEEEYTARLAEIEMGRAADQKEAGAALKELDEQERELDKKAETVQLTRQQWKSWLEKQLNSSEKQLAALQDDYRTLETADNKLSRLNLQTQLDLQRLRTEYELLGLTELEMSIQPDLLRLQQEVLRYQREHNSLLQQAARVVAAARQVLAARVAATAKFEQATGELQKADVTLNRWYKMIDKSSLKAQKKATSNRATRRLKQRLARPATWFDVDEAQEANRLLQQYGLVLREEG